MEEMTFGTAKSRKLDIFKEDKFKQKCKYICIKLVIKWAFVT